jgi:hypothetical protein
MLRRLSPPAEVTVDEQPAQSRAEKLDRYVSSRQRASREAPAAGSISAKTSICIASLCVFATVGIFYSVMSGSQPARQQSPLNPPAPASLNTILNNIATTDPTTSAAPTTISMAGVATDPWGVPVVPAQPFWTKTNNLVELPLPVDITNPAQLTQLGFHS